MRATVMAAAAAAAAAAVGLKHNQLVYHLVKHRKGRGKVWLCRAAAQPAAAILGAVMFLFPTRLIARIFASRSN